jgi:hypothetical protein
MADELDQWPPAASLDTRELKQELSELTRLSSTFGSTLSRAFASAVIGGRSLSEVLQSLVLSLSRQTLTAAFKPFGDAIGGGLGSLFGEGAASAVAAPAPPPASSGSTAVQASGTPNVTVNITTPDVQGFQRSQSQVAAMMLRALERGQRNL